MVGEISEEIRIMAEQEKSKTQKINVYLLLLLPAILSLAVSITSLLYQFGQKIFDLNNTCYYIFVSAESNETDEAKDAEVFQKIVDILAENNLTGFTILKNDLGAEDGGCRALLCFRNGDDFSCNCSANENCHRHRYFVLGSI